MKIDWKLLTTFIFSIGIVCIFGFLFSPNCTDCFRPHGWPFPYYREDGFAGGAHYVWGGMLGDFLFALTASMLLWMVWNAALPRDVRIAERDIRRRNWGWICIAYSLIMFLDLVSAVTRQLSGRIDPRLAPSNSAQLTGMVFGYVAIFGLAAWLAATGTRKIRSSPTMIASEIERPPDSVVEPAGNHFL